MQRRKGDASDIVTFLIIVFFLAVSLLVAVFANNEISTAISTTALNGTDVATSSVNQLTIMNETTVQTTFVVIISFLIIGMLVSSFMVRVHPIFLFIYIFILAITIFTAVPLANTYEVVMNTDAFATIAAQQTMLNWIMEHLIMVLLGVGGLSMIVLFAKLKDSGGSRSDF